MNRPQPYGMQPFDGTLEFRLHPKAFWAETPDRQGEILAKLIRHVMVERVDVCARTSTFKIYVAASLLKEPIEIQRAIQVILGD
jgi:hypothetical protein